MEEKINSRFFESQTIKEKMNLSYVLSQLFYVYFFLRDFKGFTIS